MFSLCYVVIFLKVLRPAFLFCTEENTSVDPSLIKRFEANQDELYEEEDWFTAEFSSIDEYKDFQAVFIMHFDAFMSIVAAKFPLATMQFIYRKLAESIQKVNGVYIEIINRISANFNVKKNEEHLFQQKFFVLHNEFQLIHRMLARFNEQKFLSQDGSGDIASKFFEGIIRLFEDELRLVSKIRDLINGYQSAQQMRPILHWSVCALSSLLVIQIKSCGNISQSINNHESIDIGKYFRWMFLCLQMSGFDLPCALNGAVDLAEGMREVKLIYFVQANVRKEASLAFVSFVENMMKNTKMMQFLVDNFNTEQNGQSLLLQLLNEVNFCCFLR